MSQRIYHAIKAGFLLLLTMVVVIVVVSAIVIGSVEIAMFFNFSAELGLLIAIALIVVLAGFFGDLFLLQ